MMKPFAAKLGGSLNSCCLPQKADVGLGLCPGPSSALVEPQCVARFFSVPLEAVSVLPHIQECPGFA